MLLSELRVDGVDKPTEKNEEVAASVILLQPEIVTPALTKPPT